VGWRVSRKFEVTKSVVSTADSSGLRYARRRNDKLGVPSYECESGSFRFAQDDNSVEMMFGRRLTACATRGRPRVNRGEGARARRSDDGQTTAADKSVRATRVCVIRGYQATYRGQTCARHTTCFAGLRRGDGPPMWCRDRTSGRDKSTARVKAA
jgi:hypothetical protein